MTFCRRDMLKTLAAAPFALQAKDSTPNILFILSDDHSYPYLGIYGADWMSTSPEGFGVTNDVCDRHIDYDDNLGVGD